jgi:hypothetical protein
MTLGSLLLVVSTFAPSVFGTPIDYNINFAATTGVAPTSGSFTYDAAAALGSQFTNFQVNWASVSFDLTVGANAPVFNGTECGSSPTSATTFAMLNGIPQCTPSSGVIWDGILMSPQARFAFIETAPGTLGPAAIGNIGFTNVPIDIPFFISSGTFTISAAEAAPAPEPSTFLLTLAFGGVLARKWRRHTA